jgi:prenyltransferase beta subunit
MSTDVELENICKSLAIKHFRGVYMMDEIAKLTPSENECYIVNLQNSNEQGSHWLSIYRKNNSIYYFDSYGAPVPNEIRNHYKNKKINNFQSEDNIYPYKPLQTYSQVICGHLCVLFLLLCDKGNSFKRIMSLLQSDINTK